MSIKTIDEQIAASAVHWLKKRWANPINREGIQEGIEFFFEEYANLALMEIEALEAQGKATVNEHGDYLIGTNPTIGFTLLGPVVHTLPSGVNAIGKSFNAQGMYVRPLRDDLSELVLHSDGSIANPGETTQLIPYDELQASTLRLIYSQLFKIPA